jgi:hypothetical protein
MVGQLVSTLGSTAGGTINWLFEGNPIGRTLQHRRVMLLIGVLVELSRGSVQGALVELLKVRVEMVHVSERTQMQEELAAIQSRLEALPSRQQVEHLTAEVERLRVELAAPTPTTAQR